MHQSAFAEVSPLDEAPAVDGIDEVLQQLLSGDWSEDPQPGSTGDVVVAAGSRAWRVELRPDQIEVTDTDDGAATQVTGDPSELLLWLWGRRPQAAITTDGEQEVVQRLRQRLALAAQ